MSDCNNLQSLADLITRNIFKSSAISKNSEYCILEHKSLMEILNSRGPNVEPCGTPDNNNNNNNNNNNSLLIHMLNSTASYQLQSQNKFCFISMLPSE
jgi:hypothetical protein